MSTPHLIYHTHSFDIVAAPAAGGGQKVYVKHPGSVVIVPLLIRDGQTWVLFVRQTRIATGERLLELPAGTREPDEAPEMTAARELPEEVGYAAGNLERLGGFYLAPGYSSEFMHVFVATDLRPETAPGDEDEDIEVAMLPLAQAIAQAAAGEFNDAKTIIALLVMGSRGNPS